METEHVEFVNERHEEVFTQVRTYLNELFEDDNIYFDEETAHFYVSYGSTVIEVSVEPYGPEDAIMRTMAYVVQDVEADEDLLRGLLELNHKVSFGSFSMVGNDIFFSHSLLGRTLDRPNVLSAVAAVATVSDDYDDRIADRWGGERALDRIRDTGGHQQRRASLNPPIDDPELP